MKATKSQQNAILSDRQILKGIPTFFPAQVTLFTPGGKQEVQTRCDPPQSPE